MSFVAIFLSKEQTRVVPTPSTRRVSRDARLGLLGRYGHFVDAERRRIHGAAHF